MENTQSAVAAGDVFAFIDQTKLGNTKKTGKKASGSLQKMLFQGVLDRVNLAYVPVKRPRRANLGLSRIKPPRRPKNIVTGWSMAMVTFKLKLRIRVAQKHGIDVAEFFEIDEMQVHKIAVRLANLLSDLRATDPCLDSIPGFDDVIRFTGIPGPDVTNVARWFRRAITKNARQLADYFALLMLQIGREASPIVSRAVLESRERQIQRQTVYANSHRFVTIADSGEQISAKFSDPASDAWRRASKTYTRLKGLDTFCGKLGLKGFFVTITLPGKYHPNPANGKRSWDGSTPVDAHKRLQDTWRSFQKRYGESGGKVFGVRVEEPHDDACPHWHALIYIEPEREADFLSRMQAAFGTGCATKIVAIDRSLGSGASYLTKYINPHFVKNDDMSSLNNPKAKKAALYDAYRATWGSRSIQYFDIPGSSTLWDELRRVRPKSAQFKQLSEEGKRLHDYATSSPPDYGDFLLLLHEMNADIEKRIYVLYGQRESGSRFIRGFFVDGERIETHEKTWKVEPVIDRPIDQLKPRTVSHSYPSNAGIQKEDLGMVTEVQMS
jgi:hypothetical protein